MSGPSRGLRRDGDEGGGVGSTSPVSISLLLPVAGTIFTPNTNQCFEKQRQDLPTRPCFWPLSCEEFDASRLGEGEGVSPTMQPGLQADIARSAEGKGKEEGPAGVGWVGGCRSPRRCTSGPYKEQVF